MLFPAWASGPLVASTQGWTCSDEIAAFTSGRGPMWPAGGITCGVPVLIKVCRSSAGDNVPPTFDRYHPRTQAIAPATTGDAALVPSKTAV